MAGIKEKRDLLREHLPYELCMMRYCFGKMMEPALSTLERNSYIEGFAVHSRILKKFLTNDEDPRNFKVEDIADGFKPPNVERIKGAMLKLEYQILHLGKMDIAKKFRGSDAKKLRDWIEDHFAEFLNHLDPHLKVDWREERAMPPPGTIQAGPPAIVQSLSTSSSFRVATKVDPGQ